MIILHSLLAAIGLFALSVGLLSMLVSNIMEKVCQKCEDESGDKSDDYCYDSWEDGWCACEKHEKLENVLRNGITILSVMVSIVEFLYVSKL